jgi:hypothetical protein
VEKRSRGDFKKFCKESKLHVKFIESTHKLSTTQPILKKGSICTRGGLIQPALWLSHIIPFLLIDSNIYLGYIKGDDALVFKTELIESFNKLKELLGSSSTLCIPYYYTPKRDIIKRIRREKLERFVWTCETPTGELEPCGTCGPCRKLEETNVIINYCEPSEKQLA